VETVLYALENGVSILDTAPAYSDSEQYVGQALRQWKGPRPSISTKAGKLKSEAAWINKHDFSPAALRQSVLNSLETLGVDQLDLLFLHEPHVVAADKVEEVIQTLLSIREEGLALRLGLGGNLDGKWLDRLPEGHFEVVMGFNRLNACNLDALRHELPQIRKAGVAFYAASPLHMGLLGNRYNDSLRNPPPWVNERDVENARRVNEIAKQQNSALSTLAHRFAFSMAEADRVVLGAANLSQLKASLADWEQGPLPETIFNSICQTIRN
jgi:aryl-alcohol dehydrogenase-like predicted oxidoreductase